MSRKTIAQIFEQHRVLIFNSSKPEIAAALKNLGLKSKFLKKGETLYNQAMQLSETQKKE